MDLAMVLGPTFARCWEFRQAAAIWLIMLNMFHGTLQLLAAPRDPCSCETACCLSSWAGALTDTPDGDAVLPRRRYRLRAADTRCDDCCAVRTDQHLHA